MLKAGFLVGSANIDETELGILNDATVSTAELNIMDGSATTQALVTLDATDGVVISDGDVMKQALVSDFATYISTNITNGTVVEDDLADDAVTLAKMAAITQGRIIVGGGANAPT